MNINMTSPNFPARDRWNDRLVMEVQYTGPASYVTGGDPYTPGSDLPAGEVFGVYGTISDGTSVRTAWWNYATQKLMFFVPNTNVQVANGVDLSTFAGTLLFTCKG